MSLYHKYRPQKFSDLIGQDHVKNTLSNALKMNRVGHAYLFSGPRGVGKTTAARLLAKSLNCEDGTDFEPCNKCSSCRETTLDKSLDVIEIDAASNRGIDEIRDLREKIKFAPTRAKYKVYIIDEVHMLTKEAFNALLKTLEEPPKHAIFVMATTELHKIPPTILSRVQQFDFKRAKVDDIYRNLEAISKNENIVIEPKALRLIAGSGEGSFRDATSILDQVASLDKSKITLKDTQEILGLAEDAKINEFMNCLISKNAEVSLDIINQIFSEGYDLVEFNKNIIELLRRVMVYKSNNSLLTNAELTDEQKNTIKEIGSQISVSDVIGYLKLFIEAGLAIKNSSLPQLPLELAVIEICGGIKNAGPEKLRDDNSSNNEIKFSDMQKLKSNRQDEKIKVIIPKVEIPEVKSPDKNIIIEDEKKSEKPVEIKAVDSIGLNNKWPGVLAEINPQNRSLYLILKESVPLKIENDKLILAIKFKIYKDRINHKKNIILIGNAIEKIYGKNYILDFVVDDTILPVQSAPREEMKETPSIKNNDNNDLLVKDALEVFGEI